MVKTDRELIEKAAAGAGIGGKWEWPRGAKSPTYWRDANGRSWHPLTDDGDAFRIAVKLHLWEAIRMAHREVSETVDIYAATRRAIVRAAAAIGETA